VLKTFQPEPHPGAGLVLEQASIWRPSATPYLVRPQDVVA